MANLKTNKRLVTVKIYHDDLVKLNGMKRAVDVAQKMPTVAKLVSGAIQVAFSKTGTIPLPSDIKTPTEKRLLQALKEFEQNTTDADLKKFVYSQLNLEPADLADFGKPSRRTRKS